MELSDCDVLILCGGQGSRIRHLLPKGCPKIMADVGGTPFVDILAEHLRTAGFGRIGYLAGHCSGALGRYMQDNHNHGSWYMLVELKFLGTAGAIRNAGRWIRGEIFFIVNGDTYCDVDYAAMLDYHLESKSVITVAHDDQMRHVGAFVASRRLIDLIPETDSKYDMEELFTLLGKRREPVGWFRTEAEFHDIGTPDGLKTFKAFWLTRKKS